MHIRDILKQRRNELSETIRVAQDELDQVDKALNAIGSSVSENLPIGDTVEAEVVSQSEHAVKRHSMPVNDAVVLAVEAGNKSPMDILNYVRKELGIDTTINSIRTRVTPLKKDGRIGHDGTGWVPVQKFGDTAPKAEGEGASTPSPSDGFNFQQGRGA